MAILMGMVHNGRAEEPGTEENAGKELVIDLTKEYLKWTDADYYLERDVYHSLYSIENCAYDYSSGCVVADLNKDGTADYFLGGYGWPEGEGLASVIFVIPSADSNLSGRVTYSIDKEQVEVTGFDRVTFLFPEEPFSKEYKITVEKGHAEVDGRVVTSAAPGTRVNIIPDSFSGEFVAAWSDTLIGRFDRMTHFPDSWTGAADYYMPASDVSFVAEMQKQTPLTFDMQKGFCLADDNGWELPNTDDFLLALPLWFDNRIDLDYDGRDDVRLYTVSSFEVNGPNATDYINVRSYFIPLPTSSITGTYKTPGNSTSAYWPLTFVFPKETPKKLYPVTVEGGHVQDEQGRTITEAAPGERIKIIHEGAQGAISGLISSPAYENLYKVPTLENDNQWRQILRQEIVMPACALSYKALQGEGQKLELHFGIDTNGNFRANPSRDVRDALKKDSSSLEKILCMYAGLPMRVVGDALIMDYISTYEYYSLEYTLPEPFITDEDMYTTVEVTFGDVYSLYPINCTDEAIVVYWMQSSQCNARILASAAGQLLYVNKVNLAEPEGFMFSGFEAKDFWMGYDVYWRLTMPSHEIELKPVFTKVDVDSQTPLVIDISDGSYRIMDHEILASIDRAGVPYDYTYYMYDLNGDGAWDVHLIQGQNMLQRLNDYSCGEYFTIETGNHGQKYFPITFVNKPKANTETGVTPTVTPAGSKEKPTQNEVTPAGTQAAKNNKAKSKKGGVLLVVFAILAMILVFGGVVGFNILRNRREEALRAQKLAELRRRRAAEAEEFEEPQYEQTAEQTQEPAEPEDEDEEDEDYL